MTICDTCDVNKPKSEFYKLAPTMCKLCRAKHLRKLRLAPKLDQAGKPIMRKCSKCNKFKSVLKFYKSMPAVCKSCRADQNYEARNMKSKSDGIYTCNGCHKSKPRTEFYASKLTMCKSCIKMRNAHRQYIAKMRKQAIDKKAKESETPTYAQCEACGIDKLLSQFISHKFICKSCIHAKSIASYNRIKPRIMQMDEIICVNCGINKQQSAYYENGNRLCVACTMHRRRVRYAKDRACVHVRVAISA